MKQGTDSGYPHPVRCTDEIDLTQAVAQDFDEGHHGFGRSALGANIDP